MSDASDLEFLSLQEALVGRYSLVQELGRGGMGVVYLAHEVALDRPVALKLLPSEYAAQPSLRARFIREAQTAAKLSHPNVVPIHAVDEVDDFVFFVMAYVEGESLGERIRARGPLPASEATRILREMAWALAYGHAQGVVHRDVKPDNILLEAGSGRALLTDFGIAQVSEGAGMTGVNEVLGTAEFMSPEQAAGDVVDERSDLYSLAVVGHYMLSGQFPFQGETVAATLAKHITQPAPPLASVAPEAPTHLAKAIDRCLAKDPAERFADGERLAAAMSRALELKREMPVALRAFVEDNRNRFVGGPFIMLASVGYTVWAVIIIALGETAAGLLLALFAVLFGSAPLGMLIRMARELLRSGYTRQELLLALRNDLDARREEIAYDFAAPMTWIDRLGIGLLVGGMAAAVLGTGAMMFLEMSFEVMKAVGSGLGLGILAALIGGPIAATRLGKRRSVPGARWLKFWGSRLGKAVFELAGIRLERVASESSAHRPTEMAIGMAADRLFDALPKDVKQSFSELPPIVRKLEEDAEKMRARVKELDRLIDDVEQDEVAGGRARNVGGPDVVDRRESLATDLQTARDGAQKRLTEAVAALETIRLELMRMHAGAGSVESMTQDLSAARVLSEDIGHLLEGRREVEGLLGDPA